MKGIWSPVIKKNLLCHYVTNFFKKKKNLIKTFGFCSAGLHIVHTRDEVDVIQNLIFYIESAYKVAVSFHSKC